MPVGRLLIAFAHLLTVATAHAAQQALGASLPPSRPYLATMGAPALRFQREPITAPLVVKSIASGPPVAAAAPVEAEVKLANDQAAASTPPMPIPEPAKPTVTAPAEPEAKEPAAEAPPPPKGLPIIPDDTKRRVQSQDFLPLFRFPGSPDAVEEVDIIVPGVPTPPKPGSLPPSSATYRQH